jgi:hypothetical protein
MFGCFAMAARNALFSSAPDYPDLAGVLVLAVVDRVGGHRGASVVLTAGDPRRRLAAVHVRLNRDHGDAGLVGRLDRGDDRVAVDRVDDDRVHLGADVREHGVRLAGGIVRALDEDLGAALLALRLGAVADARDVEVREIGQDEPDPVVGRRTGVRARGRNRSRGDNARASKWCFASTDLLTCITPQRTGGAGGW